MENDSIITQTVGIAFEQDCFVGVKSGLDKYFCENQYPIFTSFAYNGLVLPFVLFVAALLLIIVIILTKKFRWKR